MTPSTATLDVPPLRAPDATDTHHFKDVVLDQLAEHGNVAQFVSFGPDLGQRYARVAGLERGHTFASLEEAAAALLARATDRSVNVRSFVPDSPKSREFVYGLTRTEDVVATVRRLAGEGLFTIVNETVDVNDGGVSGVALGDVLEFAPGDTPRAVEKPGTAALPRRLGLELLSTVYGFTPDLHHHSPETRVEFSIHPLRRGTRQAHTIIWELEDVGPSHTVAALQWPNRFSQFIGDKAFGLLVAHLLGLPVPAATLLARTVAPFTFGRPTGSAERWLRTCPRVQTPGKFTTRRGWTDPYALLQAEDPDGTAIASVLAQAGVEAAYSGAALVSRAEAGADGSTGDASGGHAYTRPLEIADMPWAAGSDGHGAYTLTIEGTAGFGDRFMVGEVARAALPPAVVDAVASLYQQAAAVLGPVRLEWVADGQTVWVVQCHRGATETAGRVIVPGAPARYRDFDVRDGLEALRALVAEVAGSGDGIALVGDVGVTSHFGDVLRKARVPSVIAAAGT